MDFSIRNDYLALFETIVQNFQQEYDAAGIAVSIVDKHGNTLYETFSGYRDAEKKLPIDRDTIFGLASVTKSFTSLAIMQMAQKRILDLNDPISKYIPEFTNKNQDTVRIWHLLCHSGGFYPLPRITVPQVAQSLGLDEQQEGDFAYHDGLAQEGIRLVAKRLDSQTKEQGLNGRAGEYLSYCNDGFGLLSDIIRRHGGENSFAEYLNRHILAPLHMERSFCDFIRPSLDDNAAVLYKKQDGKMISHRDYHDNAFVLHGGGAMKSTIADMKKYLAMYLNLGKGLDGVRIVDEYSIREMVKPRQFYRSQNYYGYGLSTKHMDDLTIVEHGGSLPGVSSNISWSYELGIGIVVLCNTSGVPVGAIADAAMKLCNGKNPVNRRDTYTPCNWPDSVTASACGTYISGEGIVLELYKKEDGTAGLKTDGKEQNLIPVNSSEAIIRNKMTDGYLQLCQNEADGIFAVRYGGRMIPRA